MEINQANINEFYKLVQDQITKISTREEIDINLLIKNIMTHLDFLIPSETYESKICHIHYDKNNLEIKMWILSLIFMSWTLMNLTNKVKEGHCLNINHQHGDQNPSECFDGRKFYYSIYQKCIKSFYDSLGVIEKDLAEYRLY
ncbi:MAG: hypothetical protein ACRD8K_00430 [Nitrososphaeraceae archaeon]